MCPARVWSEAQLSIVRQVVQGRPGVPMRVLAAELSATLDVYLTAAALDGLCRRHAIHREVEVKHGHRYGVDELQVLACLVEQQPRLSLSQLVQAMTEATGRQWYRVTVCRARRRLDERPLLLAPAWLVPDQAGLPGHGRRRVVARFAQEDEA